MDAIELVRKDTGEVVAWACGRCHHVPGIESYENGKMRASAIEMMRSGAEHCCVCSRCGGYRKRKFDFGLVCEACAPAEKLEQEARRVELQKEHARQEAVINESLLQAHDANAAKVLLDHMRLYSDEYFFAGWLHDLEFVIWAELSGPSQGEDRERRLARMAALARKCGGWWYWDANIGGPLFVTTAQWEERLAIRKETLADRKEEKLRE